MHSKIQYNYSRIILETTRRQEIYLLSAVYSSMRISKESQTISGNVAMVSIKNKKEGPFASNYQHSPEKTRTKINPRLKEV